MERSIKKWAVIKLLARLVVAAVGLAVAYMANSLAGHAAAIFMAMGIVVGAVSWFQIRIEENEGLERLELDELARTKGSATLFEGRDSEVFPAQRSREQFERFFIPGVTVLLLLAQVAGAYFLWRWLMQRPIDAAFKQSTVTLALFSLLALVLFLLGKFFTTIARLENRRLLRPGANWLLLNAYVCFAVVLGIIGVEAGFPKADMYVARGLVGLLALIAMETLVNLILEIYRPRVKGKAARPLYESRLVGLLGQPEGLITTAAEALDYQFGFKVSETWFYRFFERALGWLILLQVGVLLLSTSVVFIETGEQALLEHSGKRSGAVLGPGAHLKWPWPVDKVYRYRTERIQSFNVGFTPDPATENQRTVLWTVSHTKEENFLVANREQTAVSTNELTGKRTPPVSLLTVSIPIQFQISDLLAWAYNNDNPTNLLQDVATSEVVRYLVSADLNEIMSRERGAAAETLRDRIQSAADARKLGAKIIFVGLQDIHPPVKVAPEYEKVVGGIHTKLAAILAAKADDIKTNSLAQAQATNILNLASANQITREIGALAQAASFTNQLPAFQAAPSVYMERAYLQTFARATANARKYILLTSHTEDVIQFDLQDKIRDDLLNMNVKPEKK
jgi:regulator of protease activity HflC (stomatin/prohibitin superfamily)